MRARLPSPSHLEGEAGLGGGARELQDLQEQTAVGGVLLEALMRRQLRLSLGVVLGLAALLAGQPLLAWIWPGYADLDLLGIPLPWLVLCLFTFPAMILLGLFYVRRAEAIDEEFSELVRR